MILDNIPRDKLARMWCELNCWELPEELKSIKPDWWDEKTNQKHQDFVMPLLRKIESITSKKECLRYWQNFEPKGEIILV